MAYKSLPDLVSYFLSNFNLLSHLFTSSNLTGLFICLWNTWRSLCSEDFFTCFCLCLFFQLATWFTVSLPLSLCPNTIFSLRPFLQYPVLNYIYSLSSACPFPLFFSLEFTVHYIVGLTLLVVFFPHSIRMYAVRLQKSLSVLVLFISTVV